MELPTGAVDALVPDEPPPRGAVGDAALGLAEEFETDTLRRSYLWSAAVTNAGFVALPSNAVHFSAGFVWVQPDVLERSRWSGPTYEHFVFGGYALVPGERGGEQRVETIEVAGRPVPIVVTPGEIDLHGRPPHPRTDTSACWVRNAARSPRWDVGILTCRHVVASLPLGSSVSLTPSADHHDPTSGCLTQIDACTIDAAVIEISPGDWPSGLSSLPYLAACAPGMPVRFHGRVSTHSPSGHVLRVFQHAAYRGNLFGQRVITDCFGQPGDSGSLLEHSPLKEGLGLYMGTVPDGSGGSEGIHQHLAQAAEYFDLALYL